MSLRPDSLRWLDGHLDLAYIAQHGRDLTKSPAECGGSLQPAMVTFPTLRDAGVTHAVSTIFVRRKTAAADGPFCFDLPGRAREAAMRQVELHRQWLDAGWVYRGITALRRPEQPPSLALTLALEGAACVLRLEDLRTLYDAGVRMVGLAWAEGSQWAGGDQTGGDITPIGKQLLQSIDELKCIHDVSHLSEKAFWSLLLHARGRIVASHSNCRTLLAGSRYPERHLSDDQIRALAQRNGLIGINLFARFILPPDQLAVRRATIADVLTHIHHIETLTGRRDVIALGSDFDSGYSTDLLPVDLQGPQHLIRLAEALAQAGWSDADIDNFAFWNWRRLLAPTEIT